MALIIIDEASKIPVCGHCKKRHLWSRAEVEYRICNECADSKFERRRAREEFMYYHPPGDD